MCGRFYLFSTSAAIADLFDLAGPVEVAPRYISRRLNPSPSSASANTAGSLSRSAGG